MRQSRRGAAAGVIVAGLLLACRIPHTVGASFPMSGPGGVVRAAVAAFNTEDCARLYALTAPDKRGPGTRPGTITACRRGFREARREGVTGLRMMRDGPGHYAVAGIGQPVYIQPVVLRRTIVDRVVIVREALRVAPVAGRWYVEALGPSGGTGA